MSRLHQGVTFYEDDRENGPFMIRIGGTIKFVSSIQDGYYSRWGSPGEGVTLVEGWENPKTMMFETMDGALRAADKVWRIEGIHTSIEVTINESR
tara:strand:- start:15703 stop:15987 length:285 start_codon:yes stop_codon:yes gene_type:complete